MPIVNTHGAAVDRGGDGVQFPQRRGGQKAATKIGKGSMDIKGNMAARGSEDITTEGREIKKKGGT